MSVRIKTDADDNTIPAIEMEDGDIGIVTKWGVFSETTGRIVQRHGEGLMTIGEVYGQRWDACPKGADTRVRVLEPGTTLEIT